MLELDVEAELVKASQDLDIAKSMGAHLDMEVIKAKIFDLHRRLTMKDNKEGPGYVWPQGNQNR